MKNLIIRRSNERGYFDHGWLKSYHTFSFARYYDPQFMGFASLRVINDDVILPNTGFPMHGHRNIEIITYILEGTLTHSDNLGNKEEIKTGEVQMMSAGSGINHSEWNHSSEKCHLLQIWIEPKNQDGGSPYYKIYHPEHFEKWALIASGNNGDVSSAGSDNSMQINQDANVYIINSGNLEEIELPKNNHKLSWIHIAEGDVKINDLILSAGDSIGLESYNFLDKILFLKKSKILVFCF